MSAIPRLKGASKARYSPLRAMVGPGIVVVAIVAFVVLAVSNFMKPSFGLPVPTQKGLEAVGMSKPSLNRDTALIVITPTSPSPAFVPAGEAQADAVRRVDLSTPVPAEWSYCSTWVGDMITVKTCGSVVNPSTLLR